MVLWSRGHFKTSAVALYIVNLILAYPNIRILIMQSAALHAKGLLAEIKSHFNGQNGRSSLAKDFPDFCKSTRLGTATEFVTPARTRQLKDPTVKIAGQKTTKAGQHYDYLFADDLVTEQNFRNQEIQEKLITEFNHYSSLLAGTAGYKTVTGTRYSFGDLYGHIIRQDAEKRVWNISVRNCWKDQKAEADGPLFPKQVIVDEGGPREIGFTTEQLLTLRHDDPKTFACQYMNVPLLAEQQLFTEIQLMAAVRPATKTGEYGPAYLFVDLGGKKDRNDKSVVVAGRQDNMGRMYVCGLKFGNFTPLQFAHLILAEALEHRPLKVLIEGTAAGNYFVEYLRVIANEKGIKIPIDTIKVRSHKDAKHLRIQAVEAPLKTGRLFFVANLWGWTELVQQFIEFPKSAHDDMIDTISLMVQFFTSQSQGFNSFSTERLPWFLRTEGVDYFKEASPIAVPQETPARETTGDEYDF